MFYTGVVRSASGILQEQSKNTSDDRSKFTLLQDMKGLAYQLRDAFQSENIDAIGPIMHEGWLMKKGLASKISLPEIDEAYEAAMSAGATGGKLLGAGGGGFMLFYCPPAKRPELLRRLSGMRVVQVKLEARGTRVLFQE